MEASHVDTIARSLQNCSLNGSNAGDENGAAAPAAVAVAAQVSESATVDLNSQSSLPSHWEQCLDLKSGEIYFINSRTGMRAKEDPRDRYSSDEDDDWDKFGEEEEDGKEQEWSSFLYYDSTEESSSCSRSGTSPPPPPPQNDYNRNCCSKYCSNKGKEEMITTITTSSGGGGGGSGGGDVLVVGGCNRCLMYFMLPKLDQICPKCSSARLLHFDL